MFVIAYDLTVADAEVHHPRSYRQAYLDIESALKRLGFERVQWSVFAAKDEDLANLFSAIDALRSMEWFGPSVKNIRAFRMEQGSDFTAIVKGQQ
jgi:virulence-associated protein VapD